MVIDETSIDVIDLADPADAQRLVVMRERWEKTPFEPVRYAEGLFIITRIEADPVTQEHSYVHIYGVYVGEVERCRR
jgi:hypothetical protein